jgi:flotillin
MDKRAEAFAHYNDAAVLQMMIEVLPQIAKEVAAPISSIDQLTVISPDGAGALPRQVNDNVMQTLAMLKGSTGLDLEAMVKNAVRRSGNGSTPEVAAAGDSNGAAAGS